MAKKPKELLSFEKALEDYACKVEEEYRSNDRDCHGDRKSPRDLAYDRVIELYPKDQMSHPEFHLAIYRVMTSAGGDSRLTLWLLSLARDLDKILPA